MYGAKCSFFKRVLEKKTLQSTHDLRLVMIHFQHYNYLLYITKMM